ncbi:MAG: AMP-binding protein, partial [Sphingomonadales bacterium]
MVNPWKISKWQPVTCLVSDRVWTPKTFSNEVGQRVAFLKSRGINQGDVVFIAHNNSLEFLADLFALWALGLQAACLSPSLTLAELENLASFSKPKAVLAGEGQNLPKDSFQ